VKMKNLKFSGSKASVGFCKHTVNDSCSYTSHEEVFEQLPNF